MRQMLIFTSLSLYFSVRSTHSHQGSTTRDKGTLYCIGFNVNQRFVPKDMAARTILCLTLWWKRKVFATALIIVNLVMWVGAVGGGTGVVLGYGYYEGRW